MEKFIIILGAGESGTGAALLAKAKGYDVFVSDSNTISDQNKAQLISSDILFEEGQHSQERILSSELVIKSPGIPDKAPIVKAIKAKGIEILDELAFAFQFTKGKLIAITGTNGKTTTTLLSYHLLKDAGFNVGLAGNVGKSMARQLVTTDYDWWVLEMSSFQIDYKGTLKPHIGVLLNITPDHLDRYEYKLDNYIASKFSLFEHMDSTDYVIVYGEDPIIKEQLSTIAIQAKIFQIGINESSGLASYVGEEELVIKQNGATEAYDLNLLPVKGRHNQINAMASIISASLAGLKAVTIKDSLPNFKNAQHRMELIANIHGVDFINDSKATNVDAVYYALEAFSRPVIWIVGGVDKGNDYDKLESVNHNVKAIICLGKDNEKIKAYYKGKFAIIEETESMDEAVRMGYEMAKDREVVLLSPACASFDLFKNYEDRGNQFRMAVQLIEREVALKSLSQS